MTVTATPPAMMACWHKLHKVMMIVVVNNPKKSRPLRDHAMSPFQSTLLPLHLELSLIDSFLVTSVQHT